MFRAAALAVLVAMSASALAQPQADIVVEGQRNRDKQVYDFVKALTPAVVGGQISRYVKPVCPAATGLSDEQDKQVVDRMRAVAKEARIGLAKADCQPNAIVIVVDDKEGFMAALQKKYPNFFTTPLGKEIVIPRESGSVAAWHIEGMLDSNGGDAGIQTERTVAVEGAFGGMTFVTESRHNYFTAETDGTRIKPSGRPHFISGVLILKRATLNGLSAIQLADYAAMRLYSKTDPRRLSQSGVSTILTIIDTPMHVAVPLTLTRWDMAFLKSLYATDGLRFATIDRAAIRQRFRRELAGGDSSRPKAH